MIAEARIYFVRYDFNDQCLSVNIYINYTGYKLRMVSSYVTDLLGTRLSTSDYYFMPFYFILFYLFYEQILIGTYYSFHPRCAIFTVDFWVQRSETLVKPRIDSLTHLVYMYNII